MSKVDEIEHKIATLSPQKRLAFRDWLIHFDVKTGDHQIEKDMEVAKLAKVI